LALKKELYPEESEIIAEAHFKLSLALEFASITRTEDQGDAKEGEGQEDETHVDQSLRDEAANEVSDSESLTDHAIFADPNICIARSCDQEHETQVTEQGGRARFFILAG
jgi:hypothetical protein